MLGTTGSDPEMDAAFPQPWIANIRVTTKDGRLFETNVEREKRRPKEYIEIQLFTLVSFRVNPRSKGCSNMGAGRIKVDKSD